MHYIFLLSIFSIFFFLGCSAKKITNDFVYFITIKSKNMRYSDIGYIKKFGNNSIELEIYSAGNPLLRLVINKKICTKSGCISKERFNELYLSKNYPKDLFKNILQGESIFNGKNLIKNRQGFEQKIYNKNSFDIIYRVSKDEIYFKDRLNNILIKIKNIKG